MMEIAKTDDVALMSKFGKCFENESSQKLLNDSFYLLFCEYKVYDIKYYCSYNFFRKASFPAHVLRGSVLRIYSNSKCIIWKYIENTTGAHLTHHFQKWK